jgi:biotin-dependent carboxylase-like uncharacterized protein
MTLTVLDAGLLTTVQDRGRFGYAHLGVPRAGALDAQAAALAGRLVGNPPDAAALETTMTGVAFRAGRALTLAVTGAPADVWVDGRAVPFAEPVSVRAGARVVVGAAHHGVRSYVAIAGGVAVPPVLGSRSTDTLAGVGPPQVRTGDLLPLGRPTAPPAPLDVPGTLPSRARLRLWPGPRAEWITESARRDLVSASYVVAPDSDRIGLRLLGPPLERAVGGELASEGMVLGAVQVPPSGLPVVLLHDHPVTGGYPVVAVVDPRDLGWCAQARPGEPITFTGALAAPEGEATLRPRAPRG